MYYDGAYAPYGENYAETGTTDRNFTGQNQDTTADLYDFLLREYHPTQGRWLSPDLLGGDVTNPQSLNRYAYVLNNPCNYLDPLGLECRIAVAISRDGLTDAQQDAAVGEFMRVLGGAGISVGIVKGNESPDYLLSFTSGGPPNTVGTTFPNPTRTALENVGYVYTGL